MNSIQTKRRKIGPGHPVYVIAEMAWSHDGSLDKATDIVEGAARAGADAMSIHITSVPDYMVPRYGSGEGKVSAGKESDSIYRYLEQINLDFDVMQQLLPRVTESGLDLCVMCNDWPSFEFSQTFDPDMYVISPASFVEEDFIRAHAKTLKPLLLRVGGALIGEIEQVIFWSREEGNQQIILLFGFQNYPTAIDDSHLNFLSTLKNSFGLQVGLADHLNADDPMALILPQLSIPIGATVIEKHITYDRSQRGEDFESALNPAEFQQLVSYIRQTERAMGSAYIQNFYQRMEQYRQVSRKRTVAACDIEKGQVIGREQIIFKRSDMGLTPDESKYLIGKTAGREIKKDAPITFDVIA